MPYLTPDSQPTSTVTVTIEIPDSVEWLAVLRGAIGELTEAENWEEFGSLTIQETIEAWLEIYLNVAVT